MEQIQPTTHRHSNTFQEGTYRQVKFILREVFIPRRNQGNVFFALRRLISVGIWSSTWRYAAHFPALMGFIRRARACAWGGYPLRPRRARGLHSSIHLMEKVSGRATKIEIFFANSVLSFISHQGIISVGFLSFAPGLSHRVVELYMRHNQRGRDSAGRYRLRVRKSDHWQENRGGRHGTDGCRCRAVVLNNPAVDGVPYKHGARRVVWSALDGAEVLDWRAAI